MRVHPPDQNNPRRTHRVRIYIIAALAATAVLISSLFWGVDAARRPEAGSGRNARSVVALSSPSPTPTPVPADAGPYAVGELAQRLLDKRAKAVMQSDEQGFLGDLLPADAALRRQQRALFRSLTRLQPDSFTYEVGPSLSVPAARQRFGPRAWVFTTTVDYDLGEKVQGGGRYREPTTLVSRAGRWWVAGNQLGADRLSTRDEEVVPWQSQETFVARGKRVLVVANAADKARLPVLVREVDAAVAAVAKYWPEDDYLGMERRVVVVWASGDARRLRAMMGSKEPPLAMTIASRGSEHGVGATPTGIHVVLDAAAGDARSAVVLRHEVTHALLVESEYDGTPVWLTEGSAEYTAYRPGSLMQLLRTRGVEARTARDLRAGRFRLILPTDKSFYQGSAATVSAHYTHSLLLCAYVADHYGDRKYRRLHDELGTMLSDNAGVSQNQHIKSVLGVSRARLIADASRWVQREVNASGR